MPRRTLAFLIAFPLLVLSSPVLRAQFDDPAKTDAGGAGGELGKTETHKWEFGVIMTGVGAPCTGLRGTAPIPQDWPEQQTKIVGEEVTPNVRDHSYRSLDGLKQLVFSVPRLGVGEKATCMITVEVTRSVQLPPKDPSTLVMAKETPAAVRKYLGPSPLIESNNSKFRAYAKTFVTGKDKAWDQVEALYDGARSLVQFEIDEKDRFRGAIGAVKDGKADKEDLNAVFVALCRAHKVPARMVWSMDSCYAEFFLTDAEGKGLWFPCQLHNDRQFGTVNDTRPILEKGDNFRVPEKGPQRFVAETLKGEGSGRPQVEFRRRRLD